MRKWDLVILSKKIDSKIWQELSILKISALICMEWEPKNEHF